MTESPALIGQRYRLGPVIGQGGMGVVRQATDVTLEREVAIKLLRADLTDDSAALDRFRAEARAAAGLSHPAIVSVFDFGQRRHIGRDGVRLSAYLVMELVRGETLYSVLRSGPLQPGRAVQVAAGILHALKHAHRQGVVHRDIKPSNIMIQPSGAVKVMDFGIAHTLGEVEPGGPEAPGERLVMGTSHYMSPEQARCEPVDGRADIYAVGCVLFEMLTGERPFVADAPELIVQKHLTDPAPAPSSRVPGLPAAFDWVVARALAKSPDGRYPNVDAFLDDLSHLADQAAAAAGPPLAAPSQLAARQPAGQADGSAEDSGPSFSIAPVAGWRGGAQPSPHAASPPATPTPFPADAPAVPEYLRRADQLPPPSATVSRPQSDAVPPPATPTPFPADAPAVPEYLRRADQLAPPIGAGHPLPAVPPSPVPQPLPPAVPAAPAARTASGKGSEAARGRRMASWIVVAVIVLAAVGYLLLARWLGRAGEADPDAGPAPVVVAVVSVAPAEAPGLALDGLGGAGDWSGRRVGLRLERIFDGHALNHLAGVQILGPQGRAA